MTAFDELLRGATLLVVAPHPDDEVLGCGLLMRRAVAAGGNVVVAWMTDGGASHGALPADARAALVARRRDEALAGLRALGVAPVATYFLGYPDGSLAAHEASAREQLAAIVAAHRPGLLAVTGAGDGHPDHRASFRIAAPLAVPHRFAYPVSARYDGVEALLPATTIAVDDPAVRAAKRAALAAHVSQTAAGGARYPLSAAAVDRFCTMPELLIPLEAA